MNPFTRRAETTRTSKAPPVESAPVQTGGFRSTPVAHTPAGDGFIELLKQSSVGLQVVSELNERQTAARLAIAEEIEALEAAALVEGAAAKERMADAVKKRDAALRAYQGAMMEAARAIGAATGVNFMNRHQIEQLQAELRATAAPVIDEFIDELKAERNRRARFDPGAERMKMLLDRRAAVAKALEAAEAMKLEPDQSDMAQRVADLRAALGPDPFVSNPPILPVRK